MAKHSRFVTFTFNSERRHNKTFENVLAFLTNRCLTNGQWCTVFTSLYFEFFSYRFHTASLLKYILKSYYIFIHVV